MKRPDASITLLAIAAFLLPIMGGYVDVSSEAYPSGFASLIAGLFGYQASTLAHGLLGILITVALCIALFKKQVIQVPQPRMLILLVAFGLLCLLSIFLSAYRMASLTSFAEWALYIIAFFAACGTSGRGTGPRTICGAFACGCTLIALGGFWEYITQPDPTWRIFSHWEDPNALAGMLVVGLFVSLGLALSSRPSWAIVLTISAGLMGTAILLTQSKGGLLAAMAGFLALFLFIGAYSRTRLGARLGVLFCTFAILLLCTAALQVLQRSAAPLAAPAGAPVTPASSPQADSGPGPSPNGGGNALGRLLNPAATAEQSAQFRMNLWRGCIALIRENPMAYGMGTYRFESAKPGNTSETKMAHNSFLQLAVEAGPLAAGILVVFLLLCAYEMLRGARRLPQPQNFLRAGVFCAVFASVIHNLFDCDLYFSGIGLADFILLGVGMALSADGIIPELIHSSVKALGTLVSVFCSVTLLYMGTVQIKIEGLLYDYAQRSPDSPADADALRGLCPGDYRVWYYSVPAADSAGQAKFFAEKATELGPTPTDFHRLALADFRLNQPEAAIRALQDALQYDPNNLEDMLLMLQIQEKAAPKAALQTAKRMVAVESTPYFSTRALPDVVPTETYQAREYLAQSTADPAQRVGFLRPAVQGMMDYASSTVPMIVKMSHAGSSQFGNPQEAARLLQGALEGAGELEVAYRALNDEKDASWAADAERSLKATLDSLGIAPSSSM